MLLTAIILFIALTVSSDFFELICSQPMDIKDLFPGYKDVMPPVTELLYTSQFRNFETFENKSMMKYHAMSVVKRNHIIFGWTYGFQPWIRYPCNLFPDLEDVFIAFNIYEERWITLSRDLIQKLGANRRIDFVVARDEVAATHVTTSTNPIYKEAHIRAFKEANDRADIVEREQLELLYVKKTNLIDNIRAIKVEYSQAYDRAFMLHLHPYGEYHIHGYQKKRP